MQHILTDFSSLHNLLRETTAKASEKNAEIAAVQAEDMTGVHELALATTRALENIRAEALVQDVSAFIDQLKTSLDQIDNAQSAQLASAQHNLQLSKDLSTSQKANLDLGKQMRNSSASLVSELDIANAVAGRVSNRLDRVNHALARVEAASAILNSLVTILSIPCRLMGNLHLRLLLLFGMPATILFFWKPKRYSGSLMATYGRRS